MANCKASLGMGHFLVNLKNEKDVYESLFSLVEMDCDLTENEDYFQDDTLELGYESEADRRVQEALKELGQPTTCEQFKAVADKVFESISNQEYFGLCELDAFKVGKNKVSLAYSYGGDYGV